MEFALYTRRLILRPWRETDLAPFAALNADPRVMEYFPKPLSRDESDRRAEQISQYITQHGCGLWAVEVPRIAPFIGFAGISTSRFEATFTPCIEVGWRLAFDFWNRGYATEAASAALDDAFARLDVDEIVSFTSWQNRRSRRVMEKLGMTHSPAEDFDHPNVPEGHPLRRHVLYRLARDAWTVARSRQVDAV
jgi:RimJ/RimL family protein N-acetyltransferase